MRIGVLCSGGDAPGMNPCLRSIVRTACICNDEIYGIQHGYEGLLNEEFYPGENNSHIMGIRSVSGLSKLGGTILHSSRSKRFQTPEGIQAAADILHKHKFNALITIGGNGTLSGALALEKVWDGQIIGLPGTIDNDLFGTDYTIGFSTAVHTAVEAVDKLRDTAGSHDLMFFVEVMGRHCGDIALSTAIASGAEIACIPEAEESPERIVARLRKIKEAGKASVMAIVAEGDESGGAFAMQKILKDAGNPFDSRAVVLGHVLRGGSPSPEDRILASELGNFAVSSLLLGETGKMVGKIHGELVLTPLEQCVAAHKKVDAEQLRLLHIVAS
ncbi:MAG: ATP-dependent 6-phosphofructokinase [Planctomycetaceae bacterium]|jgi:6-phosphofructokinase 1|nr:ATP-dependent 6-phosphofructokinase [Planctomycetaceae bacterium]